MKKCSQCNTYNEQNAKDSNDLPVCYECCGKVDRLSLASANIGDKFVFYLANKEGENFITNWPGTMSIKVAYCKVGNHNMARMRIDVWFQYKGKYFWGVNYGVDSELCHIKCIRPY